MSCPEYLKKRSLTEEFGFRIELLAAPAFQLPSASQLHSAAAFQTVSDYPSLSSLSFVLPAKLIKFSDIGKSRPKIPQSLGLLRLYD